ncbi:MAG: M23 family metallopeptidase [Alphaproteobacteria bacterium]|nr:M23 family metallopeptidase [Alphaproteobacteria bacterium]
MAGAGTTPAGEPRSVVPEPVVTLPARRLKWFRIVAVANGFIMAALFALLFYTVPRSLAYNRMLDENLALKERLDDIDDKMSEVDRMLLRLRLYDSQLKSLSTPKGDHGPIDIVFQTDDLAKIDFSNEPDEEGLVDFPMEELLEHEEGEPGLRTAEEWADAVSSRADAFIESFERAEPNLTDLVVELEDLRALEAALPGRWPTRGTLTSGYGWRRNPVGYRGYKFHSGVDVANKRGTPIYAASDGTVIRAGWSGGYGRVVEIDHGFGITTVYAHCTQLFVEEGERVVGGRKIATMGNTGRSTGPHLHFEVRLDGSSVDPMDYLPRVRQR